MLLARQLQQRQQPAGNIASGVTGMHAMPIAASAADSAASPGAQRRPWPVLQERLPVFLLVTPLDASSPPVTGWCVCRPLSASLQVLRPSARELVLAALPGIDELRSTTSRMALLFFQVGT